MVGTIEPMAMGNAVGMFSLPLQPELAMGILVGSLIVSVLSISLATVPPTALLRFVRPSRSVPRLPGAPATA